MLRRQRRPEVLCKGLRLKELSRLTMAQATLRVPGVKQDMATLRTSFLLSPALP